jgi:ABC-type glycerol-3-phosphate transport system substrate-binding protein
MAGGPKLRAIASLLVVVCIAAACSGSATNAGSSGTGEAGAAREAVELNIPAFIWGDPSELPFWEKVVASYEEKYPDVSVDGPEIPFEGYHDAMFADMSAGNAPDVVFPYDPQLEQWIDNGLLEPLNPWLEEIGVDVDELIEMNQLAVKDGNVYAVVVSSNPRVLLHNTAMFDAAGIPVPTTPEEFRSAIEAIKDNDGQTFGFATMSAAAADTITYLEIMPIIAGFGGGFLTDGEPTANSPETVAALSFIEDLYDNELIPIGQDQNVYRDEFVKAQVASLTIGAFMMGVVRDQAPDNFDDMDAAPLPFGSDATVAVNVFMGIPSGAQDKQAAGHFVQEVLSDEMQPEVPRVMTAIPARADLIPQDFVDENPWFQTVVDASQVAESYVPDGAGPRAPEVMKAVTVRYQEMLFTDATAPEIADLLQADLEALMAEQR